MDEEWISGREAAELLGIPQNNFLYYVKNGEVQIKPGSKERMREYSRADTLAVRKRIAAKSKKAKPERALIDWLYAEDVPAGLKLSMQVYPGEVDLAEAAIYQAWRKNNPYLTMAAFSPDRAECYASVQVVPVSERVALDVLSGRREEASITPEEIPGYDAPGPYTLLVTSATCLSDRPELLYQVLYRYMHFWIEQYPERWPQRIYAQAVSDNGMRIVQHFFMSPLLHVAPNAFMLDLAYPPVSRIMKRFKGQLAAKAPLPPALQWPPVQPVRQVEVTHPPPARRAAHVARSTMPASSELPAHLVGLSEYAAQLGIPVTTLKKAAAAGRIPIVHGYWKIGRTHIQLALDEDGRAKVRELYGK